MFPRMRCVIRDFGLGREVECRFSVLVGVDGKTGMCSLSIEVLTDSYYHGTL